MPEAPQLHGNKGPIRRGLPNVLVHGPHHLVLGMSDSLLQGLGFAIASQVGRAVANGTVGVHSDERRAAALARL